MLKYKLSQLDIISKKILSNLSSTDCLFLLGELGSGKTTFTRSLIHQLQEKNKGMILEFQKIFGISLNQKDLKILEKKQGSDHFK